MMDHEIHTISNRCKFLELQIFIIVNLKITKLPLLQAKGNGAGSPRSVE